MKITKTMILTLALGTVLLLAACSSTPSANESVEERPTAAPTATSDQVYRYNQLLDRDAIRPVYDPQFIPADESQLDDEQLVLGVAIEGEAKAYPIVVLNSREMVNDELAGIPFLSTW